VVVVVPSSVAFLRVVFLFLLLFLMCVRDWSFLLGFRRYYGDSAMVRTTNPAGSLVGLAGAAPLQRPRRRLQCVGQLLRGEPHVLQQARHRPGAISSLGAAASTTYSNTARSNVGSSGLANDTPSSTAPGLKSSLKTTPTCPRRATAQTWAS